MKLARLSYCLWVLNVLLNWRHLRAINLTLSSFLPPIFGFVFAACWRMGSNNNTLCLFVDGDNVNRGYSYTYIYSEPHLLWGTYRLLACLPGHWISLLNTSGAENLIFQSYRSIVWLAAPAVVVDGGGTTLSKMINIYWQPPPPHQLSHTVSPPRQIAQPH